MKIEEKTILWKPVSEYTGGRVLATNGLDILVGELNPEGDCVSEDCSGTHLCGITHFAKIDGFFPTLKESKDEKIRKALIDYFDDANKADENPLQSYGIHTDKAIAWLEKQGEKKLIDKVKPKFKVGDWVVWQDKCYKVNYNGCGYELFDQNGLSTSWGYKAVEDNAHLWTLEDAKDGDVLCYETENELRIFIYKNGHIHYHCHYCDGHLTTVDSFFIVEKYLLCYIYPATKEQRELLFQKMKDDGYEWDAEKLELKEIEQKPVEWHREDEQNLNACLGYIPDEFLRRWLMDAIHTKYDKPAWSEEDETRLTNIIIMLKEGASHHFIKDDITKAVDWLKSLKPQNHWKPTEEQTNTMKYLAKYYAKGCDEPTRSIIEGLYEQLKQL